MRKLREVTEARKIRELRELTEPRNVRKPLDDGAPQGGDGVWGGARRARARPNKAGAVLGASSRGLGADRRAFALVPEGSGGTKSTKLPAVTGAE